jgi:ATP-dependent helicase HrpB
MADLAPLPIDPLLAEIVDALTTEGAVVLEAPPGAGKTTRVPRALLDAWRARGEGGEIVVLEPRRLAARLASARVADELGEAIGESIGYQVRFEDVSSSKTRVRFVTEAILTRRLLRDPTLRGVRAVLLDEFHERNLHADVALAWLRTLKQTTRPDLALAVMSATLDAEPAARFLGCRSIRSEGRGFEVAIEYEPKEDDRPLASKVTSAVRSLLTAGGPAGAGARALDGHVLVFLPGAAEIRRATESLEKLASEHALMVVPLHGELPPAEQDRAIRPSERRKIILSTNVAESSVTLDGVVAVIDGGVARVASHDPWSGLPRLAVQKISQASCIQRAGRAGRTRPGVCVRLYTKTDFDRRPAHDVPEIGRADLTQLALELHAARRTDLEWLDAPPRRAWESAVALLERLGAIEGGAVTDLGERMLRFPLHPRAARLLAEGELRDVAGEAAIVAALLTERDIRSATKASFGARRGGSDRATEPSDLLAMRDLFLEAELTRFSAGPMRASGLDVGATMSVDRARKQLARLARSPRPERANPRDGVERPREREPERAPTVATDPDRELLTCILAGYPDRVARRLRPGGTALALAGGGSAELSSDSVVRQAEWMVAAGAEERGGSGSARSGGIVVRTASAIEPEWLIDLYPDRIAESREYVVQKTTGRVDALSRLSYDGLVLSESPAANVTDEELGRVLADAALAKGAHTFAPEGALERFLARARFANAIDPALPLVDEARVASTLRAMCTGHRSLAELAGMSLIDALEAEIGHDQVRRIHALAPDRLTLSRGRSVRVEYDAGKPPHVASRLQDFFGMKATPRVGGGKVPVVVHLLAPNQRAVQVTSDLEGFWDRHYPQIRKELARRYPRHAWPEDPRV